MSKVTYLYSRLTKLSRVKMYIQPAMPVLSFNIEGMRSEDAGKRLAQAGIAVRCGLHCAPAAHQKMGTLETGTVRVSPSVFTTKAELDALIGTVAKL